jgi:hypothetical protein
LQLQTESVLGVQVPLHQVIIINEGLGILSAMQFCGEEAAAVLV